MASASATSLVARSVLHGAQHRGREGLESIHERQKGPTLAANLLSLSLSLSLSGEESITKGATSVLSSYACIQKKKKRSASASNRMEKSERNRMSSNVIQGLVRPRCVHSNKHGAAAPLPLSVSLSLSLSFSFRRPRSLRKVHASVTLFETQTVL